jgi:hypothetical protein
MMFPSLIRLPEFPSARGPGAGSAGEPLQEPFLGVWSTTSATVNFLASIRADGIP